MWWGGGNFTLQYWDGYGWRLCPIPPDWNFSPHPEPEWVFQAMPAGETWAVSSLVGWEPPVEGFYRITVTARELKEVYGDQDDFRMQAVFELSSSPTPRLTQELAAKLIPIQTKIIADAPYYPPIPIVRPVEPIVTIPLPPIEETPFSPRDVAEMQQGFWEVGDYARRIPAKRYQYWVRGDAVYISFYRQAGGEAFLCLKTIGWVDGVEEGETAMLDALTERFLVAPAEIEFIRFAGAGNAIQPPRGIQIGDPESRIFDSYPDYRRAGRENVWVLQYAADLSEGATPIWANPLRLEYFIEDGKVAGIYFSRSYDSE